MKEFPEPGQHGMKINAIHHYGGDKYGMELLEKQLNTMFDTNIDFYVKVSLRHLITLLIPLVVLSTMFQLIWTMMTLVRTLQFT